MKRFPLLPRKKNSDKRDFGHVLVVAGSKSMTGAALLAARAALKSGAGLVTLASTRQVTSLLQKKTPEAMVLSLPQTRSGSVAASAYPKILSYIKKKHITAVAIGPGLSQVKAALALVRRLVLNLEVPVVLDADGLNAFVGAVPLLRKHKSAIILTPHEREFERLFYKKVPKKSGERLKLAKTLSKSYDGVLVLKGHHTLVVDGERAVRNGTGNPGMAKGGSGDVLTGIIAAFIAQGLSAFEAARWAVYFHGRSADIAVKDKGELGLTASDIIEFLPKAFGSSVLLA